MTWKLDSAIGYLSTSCFIHQRFVMHIKEYFFSVSQTSFCCSLEVVFCLFEKVFMCSVERWTHKTQQSAHCSHGSIIHPWLFYVDLPHIDPWNKHNCHISILFWTVFFATWGSTVISSCCTLFFCKGTMVFWLTNWCHLLLILMDQPKTQLGFVSSIL